jgi:hypothetical protein
MLESSPSFVVSAPERRWLLLASVFVCALTALPFALCALSAADADVVFSGFLLNPADGFTYLAKMRMGLQGDWLYHLPFTLEHGPGALLFTFYFALGHLSRLLDLPLIVVFHMARLAATFTLLWVVYGFIARYSDAVPERRRMWWLVALSSGLGWAAQKFGFGYSYYEQQAILHMNTFYVFLIAPHLPLATAIMLLMFPRVLDWRRPPLRNWIQMGVLSLLLTLILPFMVPLVYLVLGATLGALAWRDRSFPRMQAALVCCAALVTLPLVLYMQLATEADPTLLAYSTQNATLTPPPLAMLLAFGLLLPFLVFGIRIALRRNSDLDILLLAWIAIALLLMYLPYRYQWRFSAGLHLPIAILAALGLGASMRANWARLAVMAAMALTPVYLMLTLISGKASVDVATVHYPLTYLSRSEAEALAWLRTHVPADAAVLAGHEMGMFIPAFAGQRVIYGHVSETIAPKVKSRLLDDFFSGKANRVALLRDLAIDYVLLGPRERARGNVEAASLPLILVFSSGDVQVYKVSF